MEDIINKTKEDFKWLLSSAPTAPNLVHLEGTIQAFALLLGQNNKISECKYEDLIKVALGGFIANRARLLDEERFLDIPPTTYYQAAQYLMERDYGLSENTEEGFKEFLDRIKI